MGNRALSELQSKVSITKELLLDVDTGSIAIYNNRYPFSIPL